MALINSGTIADFSVKVNQNLKSKSGSQHVATFKDIIHQRGNNDDFILAVSDQTRGITLKSILLKESFEGFANLFNPKNEIYFLAWSWDMSGLAPYVYPSSSFLPEDCILKMKVGDINEFLGDGISLFEKRKVTAGISVRIQLWESDQDSRNFGKIMCKTAEIIKKSKLNHLLSIISLTTGITGGTITLVEQAALELSKLTGQLLQSNANDYVDYYEGYFPASSQWNESIEEYTHPSTSLVLKKY